MSKQEASSKYEQLNNEVVAALVRMREAVDRNDREAVEADDKFISVKLAEMRSTLRAM
jgi:hypothetical protein